MSIACCLHRRQPWTIRLRQKQETPPARVPIRMPQFSSYDSHCPPHRCAGEFNAFSHPELTAIHAQSSTLIPRRKPKSVTNHVVWIFPPVTTTRIVPGFVNGLISVSSGSFLQLA